MRHVKVSVGDVVVVRKYSGTEVELDGEEHRIVNAEDILGRLRDKGVGPGRGSLLCVFKGFLGPSEKLGQ
jgi:chaperonin subunit